MPDKLMHLYENPKFKDMEESTRVPTIPYSLFA